MRLGIGLMLTDQGGASAPPAEPVAGVNFAGSQSYYGGVASGALATARVRFRLDEVPTTAAGFHIIAGAGNGNNANGWLVVTRDLLGGAAAGQLVVYVGISGVLTVVCSKFFMPGDEGKVFTLHITCDGSTVWVYLDGKKITAGTAAAEITEAAGAIHIGGNSAGDTSSNVTVLDVAEGSTGLTPAEVAEDAASDVPAFANQTHRYVASESVGATWEDEVGTADLSRFGSPTVEEFVPTYGQHRGVLEIWGDSIAAGVKAGGNYGDGWKRGVQRALAASRSETITLRGKTPGNAPTYDFDYYATAVTNEALVTRLATMAADLNVYAPADSATLLAYGTSDIVAQDRTAAQLAADVATAVGHINAARPNRPIFVCNLLPRDAMTGPEQTEWTAYQAGFAAMITTLQATYSNVRGIDYASVVTDAADTDQLFDGTHPTPATYAAMVDIIAPIVAAAM